MTPISLRLRHFGSVLEEQTFAFPERPGLYFLSGPNGAGKSTVWKALTWCLFGKDAKGLKAGDVASWTAPEGACVTFYFETEGSDFDLKRTHAPNTWTLRNLRTDEVVDLAKDETNELYSMLQLDFTTWLHTVLLAQDEPMFLDLKPIDKAALFAEVMRLDKWQGFSDTASKKASAQDAITRGLERQVSSLQGKLEGLEAGAADLPRLVREWDAAQKMHKLAITAHYESNMRKLPAAKEALSKAELEADVCRAELRTRRNAVTPIEVDIDSANDALHAAVRIDGANGNEVARLMDLIDRLDDVTECPTCGKPGVAKSPAMQRAKIELNGARIALEKSEEAAFAADARVTELREAHSKAQDQAKKALARMEASEGSLKAARTLLEALEQDLDQLEEQADKLDREVNPHAKAMEQGKSDAAACQKQLSAVTRELDASTERFEMLGFWVRGFKDIRLVLIAETLDQLALEVDGCLAALGLLGWSLTFEVDRETKSGSIARGFNVFVKGPLNERQVPWESWSGGEAQRLRIAAQMGLANLIRSTTGASIALEVYDEPSNGLESQGIDDLLAALARRAQDEQRQIWVTDHHALGSAAFAGTVMVSKNNDGTHYEELQ